MRNLFFGLITLVLSSLALAAVDISGIPLPPDVAIVKPGPAVPAELARLSGAWKGAWDDVLPHILVVEKIDHERNLVQVIYAYGANHSRNIMAGKWARLEGSFDGKTLKVVNKNGAWLTYVLNEKGELDALCMRGSGSRSTMTRLELPQ